MQYIDAFYLATAEAETDYVLSFPPKLEMQCYSASVYPFRLFPQKKLSKLTFDGITLLYGGNGSGKSTLLNIMARKLGLSHSAPYNDTPFFEDYLEMCGCDMTFGRSAPEGSRIITSDDVFDRMLDSRSVNEEIDRRREALFDEYDKIKDPNYHFKYQSLDDYDGLKHTNEIKRRTKSRYTAARLPKNLPGMSNGENAYVYFTREIGENALYLLDEPENSLSAAMQNELARFLTDSVRFYNCQFIISTHSPFLLSMRGARIYDLDTVPVRVRKWTELENVRVYRDFFEEHRSEFGGDVNG